MQTPEQIFERAKKVSDIAAEKGWDAPTWDNFLAKLMLVMTEVQEAEDEPNPDRKVLEWADVTIRSLDLLNTLQPRPGSFGDLRPPGFVSSEIDTDLCKDARRKLAFAAELYRAGSDASALRVLWAIIVGIDTYFSEREPGRNFWGAVDQKIEINRDRPRLHGKKRSIG